MTHYIFVENCEFGQYIIVTDNDENAKTHLKFFNDSQNFDDIAGEIIAPAAFMLIDQAKFKTEDTDETVYFLD